MGEHDFNAQVREVLASFLHRFRYLFWASAIAGAILGGVLGYQDAKNAKPIDLPPPALFFLLLGAL